MLSPVLAGEKRFAEIYLFSQEEYANHNISDRLPLAISILLLIRSSPTAAKTIGYDKLVFATGSTPFILPLPNHTAKGVMGFRTKADAVDAMLDIKTIIMAKKSPKCLVIGGGLPVSRGYRLSEQGAKVTVVHGAGYLLNRQLDKTLPIYCNHFETKALSFVLNANSC